MGNETRLSVEQIRYSYQEKKEVLHGVSAAFAPGKITALLGANGCGKSTLLNLMAGCLKADSGSVLLNGKSISEWKRTQVAQKIAVVHQTNTAPGDMTVRKLVSAGRTPYRSWLRSLGDGDDEAIRHALSATQTTAYAERPVSALSGGQMQRVWLAMALAQDTDILLLDEITTYLDIHYQLEILHLIRQLNRHKRMTIVMVLHDINLALAFCDEVLIMKDGCVLAQGKTEEAVTEGVLTETFDVACKIVTIDGQRHCLFRRKGENYG